ncbi:MAG: DegT/DnrJ/EryC1/StrS family aminotransferase [bacterium]|nr:DegT/DnrJ/EryC1/StrS family aminotransferase [bacterium]
MIPIIDSKRQYATIAEQAEKEVLEVMRSGQYILGKHNKAFEAEMQEYLGVNHAICLNSGTDALHLALRALNIGRGDEVITVGFTFVATTESIEIVGATPVFVDIDENTFNMDVNKIEEKITSKTRAIMPVHLYGQPADMDKIMEIAKKYNLHVIEDCCQAIGAEYKGQKVGTFGDIGCYSFYPTKNLGTMGDGGLAITNNEEIKNRIIALRNHGGAIRYHHDEIGVNSRLDEIQAAILRVKLPYIDKWNKMRREHAALYNELFKDAEGIETPKELDNTYCVYHQYTIKVQNRDEVHKMLQEQGIGAMIYYPIPLHLQKVHAHLGHKEGYLPVTEKNTKLVLSLPMFAEITEEEQRTVAKTVIECVKKANSKVTA